MSRRGPAIRAAALAAGVAAVDQATKWIVESAQDVGERSELLPFLAIERTRNSGAAFGLGDGSGTLILIGSAIALALVVLVVSSQLGERGVWVALGLLAGGAAGNLIDRLRQDHVTDFIDLPAWPNFNLADVAIVAGVAVLLWSALLGPRTPSRR